MIGVGVIGYGYWGPNLARVFAESDECELVAVADAESRMLDRAAKRHPATKLCRDWKELVNDPKVDAVVVAVPVRFHYEIARAALLANKHVLIEKPMTERAEQARELIELAAKRGRVLMVDHTFVFTGAVEKLREIVRSGDLGDVYYYDSTRINLGLFQHDVNVIWDLAVHDLAILESVLNEQPVAVSANGISHVLENPENMAHVTLYFDSGVIAHLNVNWLAPVKVRQTLIGGSKKMIIYDDMEVTEKIKVYDRGIELTSDPEEIRRMRVGYRMGDMWAPRLSTKEALLSIAEHFAGCIRDGKTPITDGVAGLRVVQTLEGATQSLRRRGHPVDLSPLLMVS